MRLAQSRPNLMPLLLAWVLAGPWSLVVASAATDVGPIRPEPTAHRTGHAGKSRPVDSSALKALVTGDDADDGDDRDPDRPLIVASLGPEPFGPVWQLDSRLVCPRFLPVPPRDRLLVSWRLRL